MRLPTCPTLALLALLLPLVPTQAQETDTEMFDGRWTVSTQTAQGKAQQVARLRVGDYAGTWQDLSGRSGFTGKACRGKTFKITVQRSRPSALEFMVWGSSISTDCPDLPVALKPVDEKTLEGTLGEDTKIRLTRR